MDMLSGSGFGALAVGGAILCVLLVFVLALLVPTEAEERLDADGYDPSDHLGDHL